MSESKFNQETQREETIRTLKKFGADSSETRAALRVRAQEYEMAANLEEPSITQIRVAIDAALIYEEAGYVAEALNLMEDAFNSALYDKNSTRELIDEIRNHKDRLEKGLFPPELEQQIECS